MLLINNLSFSRNKTKIFENLNLSLNNKGMMQIKGKNGSGKTTFLKVILTILEPESGEITRKGKNIKKNIFDFYNQTTFIMDNNTSTRELSVQDNINFLKGLSSSKLNDDEIFKLLKKIPKGLITGIFLINYSIVRFLIEYLREPDVQIGIKYNLFTQGPILSIPILFIGLVILYSCLYNKK